MNELPQNKERIENPEEAYSGLINSYQAKVQELKRILIRVHANVVDEEAPTSIRIIDKEKHKLHLRLIEIGRQLGRKEEDVLVDIIRKDGTLGEYGLPEFCILKEDDIIDIGRWRDTTYFFNVDPDARRPSAKPTSDYFYHKGEGENLIKEDEVMIVFSIVPIKNHGEDELYPEDYEERVKRANALADKIGVKVFEKRDSNYHEASAKILGVIFPKKELEKVAAIIRAHLKNNFESVSRQF